MTVSVCIPLISILSIVSPLLSLCCFCLIQPFCLPTLMTTSPPFMGLGAQVPSRWSGLTFSPEYHSRSPSSITRPKPGGVVCSAVSGALSPTLSPSGRPRSPLDGLQTQCAPRNSWPGRGGDPCGFILGYWWLSRGLGQWAPIGLTSRKSSLLFGAEKQVSEWAYRGLRSATAGGRVQELGWS